MAMGEKIEGLGGWLVLVQVWIFLIILSSIMFLSMIFWNDGNTGLILLYSPPVLFIMSIVTLVFMHLKKQKFPVWIIILTWTAFIVFFILFVWDSLMYNIISLEALVILTISIGITLYIKKSQRVKNTFVK